jgi:hypothetical protein
MSISIRFELDALIVLAGKQDDEAMFCDPGYEPHSTPGFH